MADITAPLGARTLLTDSALNSLASGTYVVLGTINHSTNDPLDCPVEVSVTPGTVSGNKQMLVFAKASLDGTNFTTGPESGTTTTDEPNLIFVGSIPCGTNATLQRQIFSLAAAYGGFLPHSSKLIGKNDTGAALASSGHAVYYSEVKGVSA